MAGGLFTNVAVAGSLITILFIAGAVLLVDLQSTYELTSDADVTGLANDAQRLSEQTNILSGGYQDAQSSSSVNQQVTDTAQVQSLIDAEKQKTGFFSIVQNAWQSLNKYLPWDSRITGVVLALIAALGAAGVYHLWRQRYP